MAQPFDAGSNAPEIRSESQCPHHLGAAITREGEDWGVLPTPKNKRGRTPLTGAKNSTADLLRELGAKEY
jgi:hypothetical protein